MDPMEEMRAQCRAQGRTARLATNLAAFGLGVILLAAVAIHNRTLDVVPKMAVGLFLMALLAFWAWRSSRPAVANVDPPAPAVPEVVDYRTAPTTVADRPRPSRPWSANERRIGAGVVIVVLFSMPVATNRGVAAGVGTMLTIFAMLGTGLLVRALYGKWRTRRNARLMIALERKLASMK